MIYLLERMIGYAITRIAPSFYLLNDDLLFGVMGVEGGIRFLIIYLRFPSANAQSSSTGI